MASILRSRGGREGSDASVPGGVEIGVWWEPSVELEDRHAQKLYIGDTPVYLVAEGFYLPDVESGRLKLVEYADYVADEVRRLFASAPNLRSAWRSQEGRDGAVRALADRGIAFDEMAERVGSKNFSFVITAVTIQRQVGGSLATLFDMVAETVRQRQQFVRRIRALTAMGRMSAYVLVGLPFFLAGVLTLINRSFMAPLWQDHIGHVLIIVGISMMAIGSAFLKKIVSFKG